jgi:hypothetical protein
LICKAKGQACNVKCGILLLAASNSSSAAVGLIITRKINSSERIRSRQKGPAVASVAGLEEQFEQAILKSDWPYAVDRLWPPLTFQRYQSCWKDT